jgi:hypothetical protein
MICFDMLLKRLGKASGPLIRVERLPGELRIHADDQAVALLYQCIHHFRNSQAIRNLGHYEWSENIKLLETLDQQLCLSTIYLSGDPHTRLMDCLEADLLETLSCRLKDAFQRPSHQTKLKNRKKMVQTLTRQWQRLFTRLQENYGGVSCLRFDLGLSSFAKQTTSPTTFAKQFEELLTDLGRPQEQLEGLCFVWKSFYFPETKRCFRLWLLHGPSLTVDREWLIPKVHEMWRRITAGNGTSCINELSTPSQVINDGVVDLDIRQAIQTLEICHTKTSSGPFFEMSELPTKTYRPVKSNEPTLAINQRTPSFTSWL